MRLNSSTAAFASLNAIPSLTSIGFSTVFGDASAYYQNATTSYFISVSSYNTASVTININPVTVTNIAQAYLNYSYIRIG